MFFPDQVPGALARHFARRARADEPPLDAPDANGNIPDAGADTYADVPEQEDVPRIALHRLGYRLTMPDGNVSWHDTLLDAFIAAGVHPDGR